MAKVFIKYIVLPLHFAGVASVFFFPVSWSYFGLQRSVSDLLISQIVRRWLSPIGFNRSLLIKEAQMPAKQWHVQTKFIRISPEELGNTKHSIFYLLYIMYFILYTVLTLSEHSDSSFSYYCYTPKYSWDWTLITLQCGMMQHDDESGMQCRRELHPLVLRSQHLIHTKLPCKLSPRR